MASNNIGKWSVQAGVDAQGVTTGADKIGRDAMRMERSVTTSFQRMQQQSRAAMGSMTSNISSAFSAIPAVLGVGSIAGVVTGLNNTLNEQLDLDFLNQRLGTSVEWLSSLRTVAMENSVTADQFATGMDRLNMTIGNAATGGTEALQTFRDLRINFEQFRAQSFQQQFLTVADALNNIENRSVRARLAMELFGRGEGQRMLRSIEGGAQAVAAAMADVQARGGFTTEEDLRRFREMDNAIDRMTTAWSNTWREFLSTIAPEVTRWADGIREAATPGTETSNNIVDWIDTLLFGNTQELLAPPTPGAFSPFTPPPPAPPVTFPFPLGFSDPNFGQFGGPMGGPGLGSQAFTGAIDNIDQLNRQLFETSQTAGMSAGELHIFRLRIQGATADQLDYAQSIIETSEAQNQLRRDQDEARRITDSARSPLERFQGEMERLQVLFDQGLVSEGTFARQAASAFEQLTGNIADIPGLGTMEQGSREVAEIIANANNPQVDALQTIRALMEAQSQRDERALQLLEQLPDIHRALTEAPGMPVL